MSRKNIFEMLKEDFCLESEIMMLDTLLDEEAIQDYMETFSLEEFINEKCLPSWKNRNFCITCEQLRYKLKITSNNLSRGLDEKSILTYLEYMANMVQLCNAYIEDKVGIFVTQSYIFLQENMMKILEMLNYEIKVFVDEEKVLLTEKNATATAVAEIVESELAYNIIEYNHFMLKGDINKKRTILKSLADKIEPMRAELKKINKELESNIGFLINKMNIRHNNVEGKNSIEYVKNMDKEELENWYDEIYQMLLLGILEYENIERNKKVDELKKHIV